MATAVWAFLMAMERMFEKDVIPTCGELGNVQRFFERQISENRCIYRR